MRKNLPFFIASFVVVVVVLVKLAGRDDSTPSLVGSGNISNTPASSSIPSTTTTSSAPAPVATSYKDGTYTGTSVNVFYGNVQVQVTVSGGKMTNVRFLDYPQDRGTSVMINSQAMPLLQSEAIQSQSANVDTISGASFTSQGFVQSLQSALSQAS